MYEDVNIMLYTFRLHGSVKNETETRESFFFFFPGSVAFWEMDHHVTAPMKDQKKRKEPKIHAGRGGNVLFFPSFIKHRLV